MHDLPLLHLAVSATSPTKARVLHGENASEFKALVYRARLLAP